MGPNQSNEPTQFENSSDYIFSDAKLKKQEERRMAKEEIKFVKKKGEKGLKKIFNDQDGEDFMKNTLGVQKKSMKKGGQVT